MPDLDINPFRTTEVKWLVDTYRAIAHLYGRTGVEVWLSDTGILVKPGEAGGGAISADPPPTDKWTNLLSAHRINQLIRIHNAARTIYGTSGIEVSASDNNLVFRAGTGGGGSIGEDLAEAVEGDDSWTFLNPYLRKPLVRLAWAYSLARAEYPMQFHASDNRMILEGYDAAVPGCGTWHVTPPVTFSTTTLWEDENGSTNFPAGDYKVSYCEGGFIFASSGARWALTTAGHEIRYSGGAGTISIPTLAQYNDQPEVETVNAGLSYTFTHAGGTIGYFHLDSNYADNIDGSPSPKWGLELVS